MGNAILQREEGKKKENAENRSEGEVTFPLK